MIDLRIVRDNPDLVRASQRARGEDDTLVDRILSADEKRRSSIVAFDSLRAAQKELGKKIGPLQGAAKKGDTTAQAELEALMTTASALADQVKVAEEEQRQTEALTNELVLQLSNIVSDEAPRGGEADFTILDHVGTPRDFAAEGFSPRDHVELGEILGAIDIERGAKVSGSRFYYLTGVGAMLELALVNLAMAQARKNGFIPVIPPALVRPAAMEGTGFLGQAAENVYHLEQDDLYLVGTSEVPLAAYHMDEILDSAKLPLRYAGYSPCYRREAGAHGKDTRGIIRVHWFDKVEMFSFCPPELAEEEHKKILSYEREFLDLLEIPYRVIDVATGDLGSSAIRKFDIEAWIPTQGTYREVTSTSNCTEFQSRRLRIRQRAAGGEPKAIATLNGTLCALTRTIVAILENHQQADGSVKVPAALVPFLGGMDVLHPL